MPFVNLEGYEYEYIFLVVLDKNLYSETLENLAWRMPATWSLQNLLSLYSQDTAIVKLELVELLWWSTLKLSCTGTSVFLMGKKNELWTICPKWNAAAPLWKIRPFRLWVIQIVAAGPKMNPQEMQRREPFSQRKFSGFYCKGAFSQPWVRNSELCNKTTCSERSAPGFFYNS